MGSVRGIRSQVMTVCCCSVRLCFSEAGIATLWLPRACIMCRSSGEVFRAPFCGFVVSVGASRTAALADYVWVLACIFVCVALRLRGWLCAVATCASASSKQVSYLVGFFVHVSCAFHPGKLSRTQFSGLRGNVAYNRLSGLRGYLRVHCRQAMAACCCNVCVCFREAGVATR